MAIISKTYGKILAILLSWLGFSAGFVSCDVSKYGTPTATYKAKGIVVSETNDAPIEGIRAVLKTRLDATYGMDTVYTNNKGVFNLKGWKMGTYEMDQSKMYVELADVDDEKNGWFTDKNVVVDFSHVKFKGSGWDKGEVEKDLEIIKMTPKE